jgi:hypothetical protein
VIKGGLIMSEYLNAEIHETEHSIELRWEYEGRVYGLVMGQEMFSMLDITEHKKSPVMSKIRLDLNTPKWEHGIEITEEGFTQA